MSYRGRPPLLDEVKQREVCALISAGCSLPHAAQYVGCTPRTIRRQAERDEDFRKQMRNAEAKIRLTALETIRKAAGSHWRAAVWLLDRVGTGRLTLSDSDSDSDSADKLRFEELMASLGEHEPAFHEDEMSNYGTSPDSPHAKKIALIAEEN